MIAALFLFLISMAAQPSTPVCDRLTNDEVAGLIGTVKSKNQIIDANTCVWSGDQRTFSIMRTPDLEPEAAAGVLQAMKSRAEAGDVVRDEAGIGTQAVSEATARGRRVAIVVISGSAAWTIAVDHVYGGLKADDLLPKLRAIAKTIVP